MEKTSGLEKKIATGFVWVYAERMATQGIMLLVSIVLARLIAPEKYGIVSIVTVLVSFADIFVTGGFGTALVQKKDVNDSDYNTVFGLSFILGCIMYALLFVIAPYIAAFFEMPELSSILRVMGVRLPIAALNTVQNACVQRNMEFKKYFFATLLGTIISAIVGITMAIYGLGVWALVGQYLVNTCIDSIVLMVIGSWRPRLCIQIKRIIPIMSFGWKILAQKFVYTVLDNIQNLIIGKKFTADDLAFYNNGNKFPQVILSNVYDTIAKIMFPLLSERQDENEKTKKMIRVTIEMCTFLMAPICIGLLTIAEPLIQITFTEAWLGCVPFLQIYCIKYLWRPYTTIMQQAVLSKGRSDIVLKLEILLAICSFLTLYIAAFKFHSLKMIAYGVILPEIVCVVIYAMISKTLFNYSLVEQVVDVIRSYLCAAVMGIVVYMMSLMDIHIFVKLVGQISVGVLIYIIISIIFNNKLCITIFRLMKLYLLKIPVRKK